MTMNDDIRTLRHSTTWDCRFEVPHDGPCEPKGQIGTSQNDQQGTLRSREGEPLPWDNPFDEMARKIAFERTRTVYPSFYRVVHRAVNANAAMNESDECTARREEPYEPDEHSCFILAGELRVGLHAAGIMLSSDVEQTPTMVVQPYPDALVELEHAIDGLSFAAGALMGKGATLRTINTIDEAMLRARAFVDRFDRDFLARQGDRAQRTRRIGPDPEDREPIRMSDRASMIDAAYGGLDGAPPLMLEQAMRDRLADAEAQLYEQADDIDDDGQPVKPSLWDHVRSIFGMRSF